MPLGVVTETLTAPVVPAGVTAVIEVALTTVNLVAAALPNLTIVAPVRFVPVIFTVVPPVILPLKGETEVTVGAGTT